MPSTIFQSLHEYQTTQNYKKAAQPKVSLSLYRAEEVPKDLSSSSTGDDECLYLLEDTNNCHEYLLSIERPPLLPQTRHRDYRMWYAWDRRIWLDKARHTVHHHLPLDNSPIALIRAPRGFGASVLLSMLSIMRDTHESTFYRPNIPWRPPLYPKFTGNSVEWATIRRPCLPLHRDLRDVLIHASVRVMDDFDALESYLEQKIFAFADRNVHYFDKEDRMSMSKILSTGLLERGIVNLLASDRLKGCHVYITIDHINAFLYHAPPGKVHEYDPAVCRLLIEPLAVIMKQEYFHGRVLAAIAKSDAPEHVQAYDETGLGYWNFLQAPDVTMVPRVSLMLGFRDNEINAFDADFSTPDQTKSLLYQVREEKVATLPLDLQKMGFSESYSMVGVLNILRRWAGQENFDPPFHPPKRIQPRLKKVSEGISSGSQTCAERLLETVRRQRESGGLNDHIKALITLQLNAN